MLMENQNKNHKEFIPNNRDDIKDGHINRNLQVDKERNIEQEIRVREREMKESYKEQLNRQMEEKRYVRSVQKKEEKQIQGNSGKTETMVDEWEQRKKISDQANYRQSLDRETKEK